jgi:UDP-N-acetylmuramate dehydrogenase
VLATTLTVTRGDADALVRRVAEIDAQRLGAQPRGRNSGSTFKNPEGRHAWELVDAVGLRGYRIGDAMFSNKHANFIENLGNASAADVASLIREAQRRVNDQYGVGLLTEVQLVGEGFGEAPE